MCSAADEPHLAKHALLMKRRKIEVLSFFKPTIWRTYWRYCDKHLLAPQELERRWPMRPRLCSWNKAPGYWCPWMWTMCFWWLGDCWCHCQSRSLGKAGLYWQSSTSHGQCSFPLQQGIQRLVAAPLHGRVEVLGLTTVNYINCQLQGALVNNLCFSPTMTSQIAIHQYDLFLQNGMQVNDRKKLWGWVTDFELMPKWRYSHVMIVFMLLLADLPAMLEA